MKRAAYGNWPRDSVRRWARFNAPLPLANRELAEPCAKMEGQVYGLLRHPTFADLHRNVQARPI